jgi:eukaryotic-like serine/threonine-protein kinase
MVADGGRVPVRPLRTADPEVMGRHRIVGRLGSGGMGVVYLAEGPRGRVALKMIRAELVDDPDCRTRFQREIQACLRVSGAHTARLVDFELEADRPWLATEFIDGLDLDQWVSAHGPLPDTDQLALATGLAEALASIHAAGLVHRDLKPSNVVWTDDGPRVIDFGIVATADARPLTVAGQFIGTPLWSSPEQAAGGEATAAADVFTWGRLLCFAATGVRPFGTGRPDVDDDRVAAPLRALIRRALAREPEQRPSAQALHDALTDGADASTVRPAGSATEVTFVPPHGPVIPVGPPPDAPAARMRRRRRYAVAAAVLAVVGIVAGILAEAGGNGDPALHGAYRADGPWRKVIHDTMQNPDKGCDITLKNADTGELVGQARDLYGTWTFQESPGRYRWTVNDPHCLVTAIAGAGTATLPFTQPADAGDTDAFTAPARVAVQVVDFNGSDACSPTLVDAASGDALDSAPVRRSAGARQVVLDPKGHSRVYLTDSSYNACGMRVSAAAAPSTYRADGPWRGVVHAPATGSGCTVTLYNADSGAQEGQGVELRGTWSFQVPTAGSFRWTTSVPGCVLEPRAGTGTATLPFTLRANMGDTDAFAAPARVRVDVNDFNGADSCPFVLHDAANGDELTTGTARPASGPLLLDPKGRARVYLTDPTACAARISAGT